MQAKYTEENGVKEDTDFEVLQQDTVWNESQLKHPAWYNLKYLVTGTLFGIILIKAEAVSWFRMQEMFRLQAFHMYGVIGSAILTGMLSLWLIKKFKIKTVHGEAVEIHAKSFHKGQVYGGLLFGFGWAMTGACPGPLFALIGSGLFVTIAILASAIAGTWLYGYWRNKLPH